MMATTAPKDTWEYDSTHPKGLDTLKGDENFKPPQSDIPVEQERRFSSTKHKYERPEIRATVTPEDVGKNNETILQRRRSSVTSPQRRASRKATGSFGGEGGPKPLTAMSQEEKTAILESSENVPLYFSEELPRTTSGN